MLDKKYQESVYDKLTVSYILQIFMSKDIKGYLRVVK